MKKYILGGVLALGLISPMLAQAQVQGDTNPNGSQSSCVTLQYNMTVGSTDAATGGEVSELQDFLRSQGYLDINPTGYFGFLTRAAVMSFQSTNGILNSGYVGPITRAKISAISCGGTTTTTTTTSTVPGCAPGALYSTTTGNACTKTTFTTTTAASTVTADPQERSTTSSTLTWNNTYSDCGQGNNMFCSWGPGWGSIDRSLPQDVGLTRIDISATNVPLGTTVETCLNIRRDTSPTYPGVIAGYAEIMCWHATRQATQANWNATIDLSATPLYLPAGTSLSCSSNLTGQGSLTVAQANATNINCNVQYTGYTAGSPRYRMLRLPYNDQLPDSNGATATSYYTGSTLAPLHIKGVNLFQSFGGDSSVATLTNACLKWLRQGGSMVNQSCFPTQSISPSVNYNSPAFMPVDWTIQAPDLLSATAQQSRNNTDASFYVLTEIPPTIGLSPENIVRDYNNVPHPFIENWCAQYVSQLTHPYFCNNQSTCSSQTKIANCIALFPPASCISSNSCTSSTVDTTPPTVSITTPVSGATVSGMVNVAATASDSVGVSKVEFYVDGSLKTTDTISPYTYSWNSASASSGSHTLLAKAYDATSNVGQSPSVTVNTSTLPPTTCNLDVDGSGTKQAYVDGIIITRYMMGWRGADLLAGITFPTTATRTSVAGLVAFIAAHNYDVDGNGSQDALTDGLLITRYMLNLTGSSLTTGAVGSGATRTTPDSIVAWLNKCAPTTTPVITVISPNGGEVWRIGDTRILQWTSQGASATNYPVQIGIIDTRYSTEGGPRAEQTIAYSTPNTGSYSWTVPQSVGTMNLGDTYLSVYKIIIHSWSDSVTGVAFSDSSDSTLAFGVATLTATSATILDSSLSATVSAPFTISGTASPAGSYVYITVGSIGGAVLVQPNGIWSIDFIAGRFPAGSYPVTVKAYSSTGITGTVLVTSKLNVTTSTSLTSAPTITSISPSSGPVGTRVTINASGLDQSTSVYFNGYSVLSASQTVISGGTPTSLSFTLPSTLGGETVSPGTYNVQVTTANDKSNTLPFTVTSSGTSLATCNLDVDGSGTKQAYVDGIIITRYMTELRGTALTSGLTLGTGATRTNPADLEAFIAGHNYDVDGNGSQDALTDGLLVTRYLLNLTGSSLTTGAVGSGATRSTPDQIIAWLDACAPQTGAVLGSSAGSFSYTWNNDLQVGSPYMSDVTALQIALTNEGLFAGTVTGGFYNETFSAVQAFQRKYGINATGYVGPATRAQLNVLY